VATGRAVHFLAYDGRRACQVSAVEAPKVTQIWLSER